MFGLVRRSKYEDLKQTCRALEKKLAWHAENACQAEADASSDRVNRLSEGILVGMREAARLLGLETPDDLPREELRSIFSSQAARIKQASLPQVDVQSRGIIMGLREAYSLVRSDVPHDVPDDELRGLLRSFGEGLSHGDAQHAKTEERFAEGMLKGLREAAHVLNPNIPEGLPAGELRDILRSFAPRLRQADAVYNESANLRRRMKLARACAPTTIDVLLSGGTPRRDGGHIRSDGLQDVPKRKRKHLPRAAQLEVAGSSKPKARSKKRT